MYNTSTRIMESMLRDLQKRIIEMQKLISTINNIKEAHKGEECTRHIEIPELKTHLKRAIVAYEQIFRDYSQKMQIQDAYETQAFTQNSMSVVTQFATDKRGNYRQLAATEEKYRETMDTVQEQFEMHGQIQSAVSQPINGNDYYDTSVDIENWDVSDSLVTMY